jgi:rod shape determining protein RodA
MALVPLLLGILSVVMIHSIMGEANRTVFVQALAFGLGFAVMVVTALIDTEYYDKLYDYKVFYILSIVVQATVFIPGLGMSAYGSQAWINLGVTTMQPSELVKITFVLTLASYLARHRDELMTFKGFCRAFGFSTPIIGLVAYIDMGAGIVLGFIFVGMIFAAGIRGVIFLRLAVAFMVAMPIVYRFLAPHQKERFAAFLNPNNTEIDATYQVLQSKIAIGTGGFFGKGLGNGTVKASGFLPVQESDFIYSIICEELGFVGGAVVILLYALLLYRFWRTTSRAHTEYDALIGIGFFAMFGFQIFENIGMTMGVMPITGITLPFLSAGGSSVVANFIALGILAGIAFRTSERSYKHIDTEVNPGLI